MDSLLESQLAEGISWGFTALISGLAFVLCKMTSKKIKRKLQILKLM